MATKTTSSSSSTKKTSTPAKLTSGGTYKQGQSVVDSAGRVGTVNYDSKTGAKLSSGQSTTVVGNSGSSKGNDNIVRFDPNTGRALNPGESVINKYTGEKVTEGTKFIAASDLGNKVKDIPVKPVDPTDYMSMLTGITTPVLGATEGVTTETTGSGALDSALTNQKNNFTSMMKLMEAPPSMEEAYNQAKRDTGIVEKQRIVGDLTSQLNSIQARAQANQLSVVGQGRGIPEAIIGGQQAQIAKEAAIEALPVSAQLQAAQGNLEMAEKNLDTLFKIKSADLTAKYEYKNKLVQSVYDFATTQEKTKLDYALKQEDRKYQEKITSQQEIKDLATMALKNGAPASVLKNISNATTYADALSAASKYGTDPLDRALKQLALDKARNPTGSSDPIIKQINGIDMQWDGSKWVTPFGTTGAGGGSSSTQTLSDKVTNIDNLLKNTQGLKSAVGTNFFARDKVDLTGKKQNFIAGVQQLVSQDTLNTLINLKKQGGTLGALSDTERVMLQSAATKIGQWANTNGKGKVTSYSASEKDFKTELNTIKMLTERAINEANGATTSYLDQIDSALSDMNSPYSSILQ
jgi:major membrane immunogen (membrane-anchored lipoprotein)